MKGEGEGSLLGDQWKEKEKVLCLVTNGRRRRRFYVWWPMEGKGKGSLLGGQWKEKEKYLFISSHCPPNQFLLKPSIFPFDLKVLLYHGYKPLLTHFFPSLDL
jgi:hypothetical protein